MIKTKTLLVILTLGFAAVGVCSAGDAKTEQAVRDLEAQWSNAA